MGHQQFHIGQKVAVLDEPIDGVISRINDDTITVETEDGFPLDFMPHQLVAISDGIQVGNHEAAQAKKAKEAIIRKKGKPVKPKQRNAPKFEVDLHIGQLVSTTKGMQSFDMLSLQLETAKRQLEFAMRKRIQKVVFIHGVGDGVLKEELHYLFRRYDNLRFYDAEYKKYGLGATEVYIYLNTKKTADSH